MTDLEFLAPDRLVLVAVPLLLLCAYLAVQVRRRRWALRFTSLDLLDDVAPDRPGWRRHLAAALLLFGLTVAALAVARPAVAVTAESPQRIVILAIDTSLSMEAADVAPSREIAAKEAAGRFLDTVPDGVAVGVVAFDGRARQLISPTDRLDAVRRVIDGTDLDEGTAIGDAVMLAVDAIEAATQTPDPAEGSDDGRDAGDTAAVGTVVLLSDGETTQGTPNDEAAAEARARGVTVNTIAFGTDAGTITGPVGSSIPVPVNEGALAELAEATGGAALEAATADELSRVYEDLGRGIVVDDERREVTDWFAAAALGLVTLAGVGSLVWFGRLP